jgi:hypothetical protein
LGCLVLNFGGVGFFVNFYVVIPKNGFGEKTAIF